MRIEVMRELPDGSIRNVMPFHVCMKGLEEAVLCRDEQDYDILVKIIFLAARSKNVIVVIYSVVSNHCHALVLSPCQECADACAAEIKRRYSMWFTRKYGERRIMKGVKVSAQILTDRWHIRNTLAYIPRNALDNGQDVNTYKWSGYRGMFCREKPRNLRRVDTLSVREARSLFHSADKLDKVPWMLDSDNGLEPFSACDHAYLEQAFENDQAFFLKTVGSINTAEMHFALEERPFNLLPDTELYKSVNETAGKWFGNDLGSLSLEKKYRLLPYVYRTRKTTVSQLARVFGIGREIVREILGL